ncbi:MAG: hypothetical protein K0S47_829 [Herbinix sp.]|nr:hypothetical protein [Herbinix sp.]
MEKNITSKNELEAAKQLTFINDLKVRFDQEFEKTGKRKTYHAAY